MAIPEEQRWNCQWPKAVLRQAMTGILPETVRRRMDKAEFSPVFDLELRERQADKIEKLVQESILVRMGIVDATGLASIFESYKQGTGGYDIANLMEHLSGWNYGIDQQSTKREEERHGTVKDQGVNQKRKIAVINTGNPIAPPKLDGVWSGGEIDRSPGAGTWKEIQTEVSVSRT